MSNKYSKLFFAIIIFLLCIIVFMLGFFLFKSSSSSYTPQEEHAVYPSNAAEKPTITNQDANQQQKAIPLANLVSFMDEEDGLESENDVTDIFGTLYPGPSLRSATSMVPETVSSVSYYKIDKKYKTLSGTVMLPMKYKNTESTGYLKIYGDDILLFEETSITRGFEPIDFCLDVSNVSVLQVEISANSGFGFNYPHLANAVLE